MSMDLLKIQDHEPPMGDLGTKSYLSFCRGIWTTPIAGEEEAPANRIIHARILQMHSPAKLTRLGLCRAPGYHKCGSRQELDWVLSYRLLIWKDFQWKVYLYEQNVACCDESSILWFDLNAVITTAAIVEIRKAGVDEWWSSCNLASGGVIIEGESLGNIVPRNEKTLSCDEVSVNNLPEGITAEVITGQVRYQSRFLEVGSYLNRAGF